MNLPQAVRKHDGRLVAFDLQRLAQSIADAVKDSGEQSGTSETWAFASEMARAIAEFVVRECSATPGTADIREMTLRLLRETRHGGTADTYEQYARQGASLLFRMRVTDECSGEGAPWDRRRLMESLRTSQVARDPGGEVAREVERRLIDLGQQRISTALIHALTVLVLSDRGFDTRPYLARRICASFAPLVPRYDREAARQCSLPTHGPALEAFWLQSVHSPEVSRAVSTNALGLEPFPYSPDQDVSLASGGRVLDPLQADDCQALETWAREDRTPFADVTFRLLANDETRLSAWPSIFSSLNAPPLPVEMAPKEFSSKGELVLILKDSSKPRGSRQKRCAPPITINVGGALMREAIRDQQGATERLAQWAGLAAQAHREREEYWGYSATRGRGLPILPVGLWNAAAWLCKKPFDQTEPLLQLRLSVSMLVNVLNSAINTYRETTGMNLLLLAATPEHAGTYLWARDRSHFSKDGLILAEGGSYDVGLELKIRAGMAELNERVDFLKSMAPMFDEPSPLCIEVPLGREPDPANWRELLNVLSRSNVPRIRLIPGGGRRGIRLVARQLREHLEGFPLFEG